MTVPELDLPNLQTLAWMGSAHDGFLRLIDQTRLPTELVHVDCHDVATVWEAIKSLRVRGAPAIGVAAAYATVLGARAGHPSTPSSAIEALNAARTELATSRPTAVNLFWALDRMGRAGALLAQTPGLTLDDFLNGLLLEANAIADEDRRMCRDIGRHGAKLLPSHAGILTHCNAGALATVEYGTALAVIYSAHDQGKSLHVYADETRPLLQGARLTAWELQQRGIPVTVICDNMAAQVMKEGRIQAVLVGADRIAVNGDTANKIGTYGVALLARAHRIPFYVAAPSSTFDLSLPSGHSIPIEQRDPSEVTRGLGKQTVPDGVQVYNPAFDVTPAELITSIITEKGLIQPVLPSLISELLRPEDRSTISP